MSGVGRRRAAWLPARLGFGLLGLAGVLWPVLAHEPFEFAETRTFADRVSRGDVYRLETLRVRADAAALPLATCHPATVAAQLVIQVRAAQSEFAAANLSAIDGRFAAVQDAALRLIACAPQHSLGWLSLFWVRSIQTGLDLPLVPLLQESYRTGPNETWIQLRRSSLAMSYFRALPELTREEALAEYLKLVSLFQFEFAREIFVRMDDGTRAVILSRLKSLPRRQRSLFARVLYRAGIEVDLPELMERPDRPWLY